MEELLVALDRLFEFVETFHKDMSPERVKSATQFYIRALEDFPADLVNKAIDECCATFKYGIPKPAELRGAVAEDFAKRKNFEILADRALRFGE
jgi:hypothetical protein